jgi:hypothetical protein
MKFCNANIGPAVISNLKHLRSHSEKFKEKNFFIIDKNAKDENSFNNLK